MNLSRAHEAEARHFADVVERRLTHALHAAERRQQHAAFVRTDPRNLQQFGRQRPRRALLALERYGKAMRFVARLLQHAQRWRAAGQTN